MKKDNNYYKMKFAEWDISCAVGLQMANIYFIIKLIISGFGIILLFYSLFVVYLVLFYLEEVRKRLEKSKKKRL